jgi:hypothetical protein
METTETTETTPTSRHRVLKGLVIFSFVYVCLGAMSMRLGASIMRHLLGIGVGSLFGHTNSWFLPFQLPL